MRHEENLPPGNSQSSFTFHFHQYIVQSWILFPLIKIINYSPKYLFVKGVNIHSYSRDCVSLDWSQEMVILFNEICMYSFNCTCRQPCSLSSPFNNRYSPEPSGFFSLKEFLIFSTMYLAWDGNVLPLAGLIATLGVDESLFFAFVVHLHFRYFVIIKP